MFRSCRHPEFVILRLTGPPTSTFVTIKLFVPNEPLPPRPTSAIATTSSQPTFSCIQSRLLESRIPGESTRPIGPPPSLIDQAINVHLTSAARRPNASARSGFAALPDDRALHTTYLSLSRSRSPLDIWLITLFTTVGALAIHLKIIESSHILHERKQAS